MKIFIVAIAVLSATPVLAQPVLTNGQLQALPASGSFSRATLDAIAAKSGPSWLAYSVPIVEGDRWICDGTFYGGRGVQLERGGVTIQDRNAASAATQGKPVMMLEGARNVWVLYRLADGRVERIRIASEDCTLDAGGLTVNWLAAVSSADSVNVLSTFLAANSGNKLADGALTALAMHRDSAALDRLLTAARDGATTHVRGQALFWLAQRAGDKAIGAISAAIADDPETDVKRRAVFALSQLPRDEGVPKLIEVARTNSNPAVRKQAMFWLGQSRDPRAVKFFEEILFK
jgi:hypothetical protein